MIELEQLNARILILEEIILMEKEDDNFHLLDANRLLNEIKQVIKYINSYQCNDIEELVLLAQEKD